MVRAGDGHTTESDLPTHWDASSVVWKTPLKGRGQASPTIWRDRIFLTHGVGGREATPVILRGCPAGPAALGTRGLDGRSGEIARDERLASATCATDGEVVVAFFGKGGLHAYTLDGQPLWSRDLGPFEGPWGSAASPVIVGELVIQNGDSDRDAFLEAFDRKTGKTVWRRERPEHRGWSTPVLIQRAGREQLVLNGHTGVRCVRPRRRQRALVHQEFQRSRRTHGHARDGVPVRRLRTRRRHVRGASG